MDGRVSIQSNYSSFPRSELGIQRTVVYVERKEAGQREGYRGIFSTTPGKGQKVHHFVLTITGKVWWL